MKIKKYIFAILFTISIVISIWSIFMIFSSIYAIIFHEIDERSKKELIVLSIFPSILIITFGILSSIFYSKLKNEIDNLSNFENNLMTEIKAEKIINSILRLRKNNSNNLDNIILELKKEFEYTDDELREIIELTEIGLFRASIISSGNSYPNSNIKVEDNIILKTSFKMHWIELKGENDYKLNFENKHKKS